MARDWFVDGDNGNNGNDATAGQPQTSMFNLADLFGGPQPGDTVYLAGWIFEDGDYPVALDGVTIKQDPNGAPWRFWSGVLAGTGWASIGGGVYTKTLATGLTLCNPGFAVNYRTTFDALGGKGWLATQANAAAVAGVTYGAHYDSGTGLATIKPGVDPNTNEITFHIGNRDVFRCDDLHDCDWQDYAACGCYYGAGVGYGCKIQGYNNTFSISMLADLGYHSFGIVAGANNRNNTITIKSDAFIGGAFDGATVFVIHSLDGVTGDSNNIVKGASRNAKPTIRISKPRDPSGAEFSAAFGYTAAYSHTSGVGTITGITWQDFEVDYLNRIGSCIGGADCADPTDEQDWRTFGIRIVRVNDLNAKRNVLGANGTSHGGLGFSQCRHNFPTPSDTNTSYYTSYHTILLSGCVIDSMTDAVLFGIFAGVAQRLLLVNCTVLMRTPTVAAQAIFNHPFGTADVECWRTLFAFKRGAGSTKLPYQGSPTIAFHDCAYYGFSSTAQDTDPGKVVLVTNPFVDIDVGGELTPAARLLLKKPAPLGKGVIGFNGVPDQGYIGAYQYAGGVVQALGAPSQIGLGLGIGL